MLALCKNKSAPYKAFLTSSELDASRCVLIRSVQAEAYSSEIKLLSQAETKFDGLSKHNPLRKLKPFVDERDRILRVSGRLIHSSLSNEAKHPPILPKQSHLSQLFAKFSHLSSLHSGPTLTQSILQQQVWIISVKVLIKGTIHSCLICQRVEPRTASQLMGDLPSARVTPYRPFTCTGLDYAGPFLLRTTKGRGHRSYKGYIALFICFATRAIYLEAVGDLTTSTFLAAYRRFAGRRGVPKQIYSDNGTAFQGAALELRQMFDAGSEFYREVSMVLSNEQTFWNFIPPNAPHCGGIWEAGVKSTKHHLFRMLGDRTLTFEEFSTLLVQIEVCLNSRPLYPLSGKPDDLDVLTPSNFLIGTASDLIPDSELPNVPENRLNRHQLLQRIRNQFWKRWSAEYLHHLQQRSKWQTLKKNFAIGQLVLIQSNCYPPSKWPLARVIETHPRPDGLVRVVTVKLDTGTLRRHISRLSPLTLPATNSETTTSQD